MQKDWPDYGLECLQGISDNIPTLASHGMKFIEIFIIVYFQKHRIWRFIQISDLPYAQAYSRFLGVRSKFSHYNNRNLWQGFIWQFILLTLKKVRSTTAEL